MIETGFEKDRYGSIDLRRDVCVNIHLEFFDLSWWEMYSLNQCIGR